MFRTFCIVCSPSPSSIFFSKEKGDQIYQHVNLFAKPSSLVPPQRPWQPDRAEGDLPGTESGSRLPIGNEAQATDKWVEAEQHIQTAWARIQMKGPLMCNFLRGFSPWSLSIPR